MLRVLVLVLCVVASRAVAANLEAPRVASYAGYTRLVFDLPPDLTYRLEPIGAALRITFFGGSTTAKTQRLNTPEVSGFVLENGGGNVVASIATPQGVSSRRWFRLQKLGAALGKVGFRLVLDVSGAYADTSPLPNVALPKTKAIGASVLLDPGHGGTDLGALGNGLRETDLNLDLAFRVKKWLELAQVRVEMTRTDNRVFSDNKRTDLEARAEASKGKTLFVSIHTNAIERRLWNSTYGMEVYYFDWVRRAPWLVTATPAPQEVITGSATPAPPTTPEPDLVPITNFALAPSTPDTPVTPNQNGFGSWQSSEAPSASPPQTPTSDVAALTPLLTTTDQISASKSLAARVLANMLGATGAASRGVQVADFYVIRHSHCPAILLEMGFITHPIEAEQLRNANYLERIAYGVALGITQSLDDLVSPLELSAQGK